MVGPIAQWRTSDTRQGCPCELEMDPTQWKPDNKPVIRIGFAILLVVAVFATISVYLRQKDYVAERRRDCLAVYQVEQQKWSNTERYEYDEQEDACLVYYKDEAHWQGVDCLSFLDPNNPINEARLASWSIRQNMNCLEGVTDRVF